jgi:hypothetical protein
MYKTFFQLHKHASFYHLVYSGAQAIKLRFLVTDTHRHLFIYTDEWRVPPILVLMLVMLVAAAKTCLEEQVLDAGELYSAGWLAD